jgi:hypothetical protein
VETYHMLIRKIDTYKYKCEFANIFIWGNTIKETSS